MRASYVAGTEWERFWPKVVVGDCWEWAAATNDAGYGIFRLSIGRNARAHRWAYETLVGPIPEGLTLDHLCRVRHCVNPDHLEPVSHATNAGRSVPGGRNWRRLRTHCKNGHAFADGNEWIYRGQRRCRECGRIWQRRTRAKRREKGGTP